MAILDEVKQMQQQGQTTDQITQALQARGISQQEISDALSQTQIQQAVDGTPPPGKEAPAPASAAPATPATPVTQETQDQGYSGMEPSIMQDQSVPATQEAQAAIGQDPYL